MEDGVSRRSAVQVHFKWSITSLWDAVLLPSCQKVIKKSKPKSPPGVLRDSVVHTADI